MCGDTLVQCRSGARRGRQGDREQEVQMVMMVVVGSNGVDDDVEKRSNARTPFLSIDDVCEPIRERQHARLILYR